MLEHRESVAQTAVGAVGDRREGRVVDRDTLTARHLSHLLDHHRDGDPPERVALTARKDRNGEAFGFRGREDENRVRRRLLERLEKGVRALFREHVRLVDDVDFHPHRRGRKLYGLPQGPDFVDPAVARRVDLENVQRRTGQH